MRYEEVGTTVRASRVCTVKASARRTCMFAAAGIVPESQPTVKTKQLTASALECGQFQVLASMLEPPCVFAIQMVTGRAVRDGWS